jgi:sec-independent protein translocase protein TatA
LAWDDPVVIILIVAAAVLLFGAGKIPQLAKGLGQARREFDIASKGLTEPLKAVTQPVPTQAAPTVIPAVAAPAQTTATGSASDPLIVAAQNEGIDTFGKTREQIASELAWKLKK